MPCPVHSPFSEAIVFVTLGNGSWQESLCSKQTLKMEILGCLPGTSTSNCLLGFWDFKVFFFFFLYFLGIELGQQDLASGGSLFWGLMFRSNSFL